MDLGDAIRRRRMVRAFEAGRPIAPEVLDRMLDAATRAPSAGFTQGVDLLVLDAADDRGRFWDLTFPDPAARAAFRWQGLFDAAVIVLPLVEPGAYAARYAEPDKVATGLAEIDAWSVPYWWVDGGMAVEHLLLAAVDEGLGALFYGLFERERAVLDAFAVPSDRRALGVVALGHPAPDARGLSVRTRRRRPFGEVVHRGRW